MGAGGWNMRWEELELLSFAVLCPRTLPVNLAGNGYKSQSSTGLGTEFSKFHPYWPFIPNNTLKEMCGHSKLGGVNHVYKSSCE